MEDEAMRGKGSIFLGDEETRRAKERGET